MNDSQRLDHSAGDAEFESLLRSLRALEPPLETRLLNRAAVSEALAQVQSSRVQRELPWWRRTIPVPVPLAIGLAAAVMAAFVMVRKLPRNDREIGRSPPSSETQGQMIVEEPSPIRLTSAVSTLQYYERQTYLVGVGPIQMESGYQIEE